LIPPRSSLTELVINLALTLLYGAAITFYIHGETLGPIYLKEDVTVQVAVLIIVFLTSSCLISHSIPESTPYITSEAFHLFSSHYSRVIYQLLIIGGQYALLRNEEDFDLPTGENYSDNSKQIFRLFIAVFICQVLGILGNPFVLLMWLFEQMEIFVFGSTTRASDLRIFLSWLTNFTLLHIPGVILQWERELTVLSMVGLTYIQSHNLWRGIGFTKAHSTGGERAKDEETYASIVFDDRKATVNVVGKGGEGSKIKEFALHSFIPFCLVIGATCLVIYEVIEIKESTMHIMLVVLSILFLICYLVSTITRRSLLRIIPCPFKKTLPAFPALVLRSLTMAISAFTLTCLTYNEVVIDHYVRGSMGQIVFIYRAYNRIFHAPMQSAIEIIEALIVFEIRLGSPTFLSDIGDYSVLLAVLSFVNDRILVLINKVVFIAASIMTAYKNKKQRFKSQTVCFAL